MNVKACPCLGRTFVPPGVFLPRISPGTGDPLADDPTGILYAKFVAA